MTCRHVADLLHRAADSLDDSEQLVLEEHLETCERCRIERGQLAAVRRIGESLPRASIGPRGHQRAIAEALMRGNRVEERPRARARAWKWLGISFGVMAAGAIAAAAVGVVVPRMQTSTSPSTSTSTSTTLAPVVRHVGLPVPRFAIPGADALRLAADRSLLGETEPVPAPHVATSASASAELALARRAYVAGAFADARRHATAALAAGPSRAQSAEAQTIVGECAQATGDLDTAAARYALVAARYADLPAGETALFTAARLAATRHASGARDLYDRYLARYPRGRFVDDAQRERARL